MMDIRKLQKKLLKEELRRQRKKSSFWRRGVPAALLGLALLFGGLLYYLTRLDNMLEEDFVQAEGQLNRGDNTGALAAFQAIYQRHPSFQRAPEALFQAGEILNLYLQRYQEALLAYLLLEKDYPAEQDLIRKAQLRVAELYKNRLRDYAQAIVVYRKLLASSSENADRIQYEIADACFRLEKYEQARSEFERLCSDYPHSPLLAEARYRLGTIYSLLGNNTLAIQAYQEVASRWPESPYALEAQYSLAAVHEERDELQQALALLQALQGRYANAEALNRKLAHLKSRIGKKR